MGILFIIVLFIFLIAARACWVSARGRFGLKKRSTKVGVLLIKPEHHGVAVGKLAGEAQPVFVLDIRGRHALKYGTHVIHRTVSQYSSSIVALLLHVSSREQ